MLLRTCFPAPFRFNHFKDLELQAAGRFTTGNAFLLGNKITSPNRSGNLRGCKL